MNRRTLVPAPLIVAALLALAPASPTHAAAPQADASHADATTTAEIDALLAALAARYANAETYRDTGYELWLADPESWGRNDHWAEWTLAFERRATPHDGESPSVSADMRWLAEERSVGKWGAADLKILWADGLEFRTWTAKSSSHGTSDRGVRALEKDWELLPLRLAVLPQTWLRDPFAPVAHRTSLGEAEVNGARCLGVELREKAGDSTALRLWIAADDHSLRRLETGFFEGSRPRFHREITYHPRFDEPLPASALPYDPPWWLFAFRPSDLGIAPMLIGTGAGLLVLGLLWLRRRRPWLLGRNLVILSALYFQSWQAIEFLAAWLRLPAELHGRVLEVPWLHVSGFAFLLVGVWGMTRYEWSAFGVTGPRMRAALEALVERRGGEPRWTRARRWFGNPDVIELPDSRLRAESKMGVVSLRGRAEWGERRRWRHALERQLVDDGLVVTQAAPGITAVIGGTLFVLGLGILVL